MRANPTSPGLMSRKKVAEVRYFLGTGGWFSCVSWRCSRSLNFFGPLFSFFMGNAVCSEKSLAGDENGSKKNSQLPSLRQNLTKRSLGREAFGKSSSGQMPSLWKPENLEGQQTVHPSGQDPALFVPRLRLAILTEISKVPKILFFFFRMLFNFFKED
jgi:hypothetical protein